MLHVNMKWAGLSLKPVEKWLVIHRACPQQLNLHDCGIYTMALCRYLMMDIDPDYTQADLPYLRLLMCNEILNVLQVESKFANIVDIMFMYQSF